MSSKVKKGYRNQSMLSKEEVQISDDMMRILRCCACGGYLSSSPLQSLPDGRNLCGRCSYPIKEEHARKNVLLELISFSTVFPCRYKEMGCTVRLKFDSLLTHENICIFKKIPDLCFACPKFNHDCHWEGSHVLLGNHFFRNHQNFVQLVPQFHITLDKDHEGLFVTIVDGVEVIVKFIYKATMNKLTYDLRYLACDIQSATYKVYMKSVLNCLSEASMSWSTLSMICRPYDFHFQETPSLTVSIPRNLVEHWDYKKVFIIIDFNWVKVNLTGSSSLAECNRISSPLIKDPECGKCHRDLPRDVFILGNKIICLDCADDEPTAKKANDNEIDNFVRNTRIQCCWKKCDGFIKKQFYKQHITRCRFRVYDCFPIMNCEAKLTRDALVTHLCTEHYYEYFSTFFKYSIRFKLPGFEKRIFTMANFEIFSFRIALYANQTTKKLMHFMESNSTTDCPTVLVQIVHRTTEILLLEQELHFEKLAWYSFDESDLPSTYQTGDEIVVSMTKFRFGPSYLYY